MRPKLVDYSYEFKPKNMDNYTNYMSFSLFANLALLFIIMIGLYYLYYKYNSQDKNIELYNMQLKKLQEYL